MSERDYSPLSRWCRQGTFGWPSELVNALVDRGQREVRLCRPLSIRERLSKGRDSHISARVIGLFFRGGPAAIIRAVSFVVVHALNRAVFGRTRPHVSHESEKGCAPLLADGNSAPSVSGVSLGGGPVAPSFHAAPRFVFSALALAMRFLRLKARAATAFGVAAFQANRGHDALRSAVAATSPERFTQRIRVIKLFNQPPSESHPSQVLAITHNPKFYHDWCARYV